MPHEQPAGPWFHCCHKKILHDLFGLRAWGDDLPGLSGGEMVKRAIGREWGGFVRRGQEFLRELQQLIHIERFLHQGRRAGSQG